MLVNEAKCWSSQELNDGHVVITHGEALVIVILNSLSLEEPGIKPASYII